MDNALTVTHIEPSWCQLSCHFLSWTRRCSACFLFRFMAAHLSLPPLSFRPFICMHGSQKEKNNWYFPPWVSVWCRRPQNGIDMLSSRLLSHRPRWRWQSPAPTSQLPSLFFPVLSVYFFPWWFEITISCLISAQLVMLCSGLYKHLCETFQRGFLIGWQGRGWWCFWVISHADGTTVSTDAFSFP